jgi:hypothetical protein
MRMPHFRRNRGAGWLRCDDATPTEYPTMLTSTTDLATLSKEELIRALQIAMSQPARKLTMKVSDKGALSVYGLGRFPVTLYRSQWERLFSAKDEVETFITVNAALLTVKA